MTTTRKTLSLRVIGMVTALVLLLTGAFATTAFAAGVEDLNKGYNEMGSFTFTNTNTSPTKTIYGNKVTFYVTWRTADGAADAPDVDAGIGETKLTLKILDANTGTTIAGPLTFTRETTEDSWYMTDEISVNVTPGQQVRVWFDASSAGASNGHYRSIYVDAFDAEVE